MSTLVHIGTAGWSLDKNVRDQFPPDGFQLTRFAHLLNCCEINSTFYRTPRQATCERWAASVPTDFRFSLKAPKQITHNQKLRDCGPLLHEFLDTVRPLSERGTTVLLFQLPPGLLFDPLLAARFFETLRARFTGHVVCEPRHPSWFESGADSLWNHFQVGRVAADPPPVPSAREPGGWHGLSYFRWHGSPRMYYSSYAEARLMELAAAVESCNGETMCIFDNTAGGEATANALKLKHYLQHREDPPRPLTGQHPAQHLPPGNGGGP